MITFRYVVTVNEDGTIDTQGIEANDEIRRKPTAYDIYVTSKELAANIDSQMLADRVATIVLERMAPADPSAEIKQKLIDALSDRGIETPKNQ
jgi:galactitol-specific phosphotransferase system IIB component